MASSNLQIPDVVEGQAAPDAAVNMQIDLLDKSANGIVSIAITGDTDLTTTQTRENFVIRLTGTPGSAFNLDMPDTNRRTLAIINDSDSQCTVRNSADGGTGQPVIPAGESSIFHYDGTNFLVINTGSGGGGGSSSYDLSFGFGSTPTGSQVIGTIMIGRAITLPGDMSGSVGDIGTNPTSSFEMSLEDDSTEIGTVTIDTGGGFTFATTGGNAQSIAAGSKLDLIAPGTADATAADLALTLLLTED